MSSSQCIGITVDLPGRWNSTRLCRHGMWCAPCSGKDWTFSSYTCWPEVRWWMLSITAKHHRNSYRSFRTSGAGCLMPVLSCCMTVADGGFEIWGGHDVMSCIKCICIKYKYSNCYLYSNITRRSFSLQSYQLIHHATWVDSSSLGIPFSIDTQARAESLPWVVEFLKKNLHDSNMKNFFPCKLFESRNQMDWPPYVASVLNIKTEQASFLIGWTAIAMVTEEDFVSISYLKVFGLPEDSSTICWTTLLPQVSCALSVTSSKDTKTSLVLWAWTFLYISRNPE